MRSMYISPTHTKVFMSSYSLIILSLSKLKDLWSIEWCHPLYTWPISDRPFTYIYNWPTNVAYHWSIKPKNNKYRTRDPRYPSHPARPTSTANAGWHCKYYTHIQVIYELWQCDKLWCIKCEHLKCPSTLPEEVCTGILDTHGYCQTLLPMGQVHSTNTEKKVTT